MQIGQFLLRRLREAGIKHLFGVPGDHNSPALSDPERLQACVDAIVKRLQAAHSPAFLLDLDAQRSQVIDERARFGGPGLRSARPATRAGRTNSPGKLTATHSLPSTE